MPARSDSVRSQTNLQTFTLEYIVDGPLDGQTIAPPIILDENSPDYVAPDPVDQVYRITLPPGQALGLIDLSLATPDAGGIGDRYVRWFIAGNSENAGAFAFGTLGVYDNLLRQLQLAAAPLLLETVRTINGVPGFYEKSCIFVPQGAYIGISGLAAPASGRNVVRINVQAPRTVWEAALAEESCCCDESGGMIPPTVACPAILDIAPTVALEPLAATPVVLTITGSGFRDGLAIRAPLALPATGPSASLGSFIVIDSNTATVEVVYPTAPGTYNLIIFDPADPLTCSTSATFTIQGS
jgi:hypothetical protein